MGGVGKPFEGLVYSFLDHLEGVLALPRVAREGIEDVASASNYIDGRVPLAQE